MPNYSAIIKVFLIFLLTVSLLILTAIFLAHIIPVDSIHLAGLYQLFLPTIPRVDFNPKPLETTIFHALVLLSPLYIVLSAITVDYFSACSSKRVSFDLSMKLQRFFSYAIVIVMSNLLFFVSWDSFYMNTLTSSSPVSLFSLVVIILCLAVSMRFFFSEQKVFSKQALTVFSTMLILLMVVGIFFQTIGFRLLTFNFFTHLDVWRINTANDFGAVFYSVVQVMHGKTLLVDQAAQYGLYAELLYPVFHLIGLSIFKFTTVMGALQIAGLLCLLGVALKLTRSYVLTAVYLFAILMTTGSTLAARFHIVMPYYQYYPLRFFFPALSIGLFLIFVERKSMQTVALFSVLSAVAIIWNLESGIAVYGAFLSYLIAQMILIRAKKHRQLQARFLATSLFITISLLALFVWYLKLKSHAAIHWDDLFSYPQIFSQYGFMHLSIPLTWDMWMVFASAYLIGLILPIRSWMKQRDSTMLSCLFFISVLGIGLFAYYQYRAHVLNLINVSWTPWLLLLIFCSQLLTGVRQKRLPLMSVLLMVPILVSYLTLDRSYFVSLPALYRTAVTVWQENRSPAQTGSQLLCELHLIKRYTPHDDDVVMLTPYQAVLYNQLNRGALIKGPGVPETILRETVKSQIDQLMQHPVRYVLIGATDAGVFPSYYRPLSRRYAIARSTLCPFLYMGIRM
ncbi:MAG TPA: hypothetical protein DIC51_06770 [Coxiellaceae bacterium]|nr:hypothetical protein [Coxiellaceae bacterium]